MRSTRLSSIVAAALAAAVCASAQAVTLPRETIDRNIEACKTVKRERDPRAPQEDAVLHDYCVCATETYFAGFTEAEWRQIQGKAARKDQKKLAARVKARTDEAETQCRKKLNLEQ